MKILVACEESQVVCKEFRKLGHEAYSCDTLDCSGGHPEWHIKDDVLKVLAQCDNGFGEKKGINFTTMDGTFHILGEKWDMIIAFPPCTFISNAGACRLYPTKGNLNMERYEKGLKGKEFFMKILNADCDKIAVENPVSSLVFKMPKHTQEIQPYQFGHPFTKKTRLWLKGLPQLTPTDIVKPKGPYVCGNSEIWKKQAAKGEVIGKEKSSKHRSKTFPGIAKTMAKQWG